MTFIPNILGSVSSANSNTLAQKAYNTRANSVTSGTTSDVTLDGSASGMDDTYNGQIITICAGTGKCQSRLISDYDGTAKTATISPDWDITPDSTSKYVIHANSGICQDSASEDTVILNTSASSIDDFYSGCFISILHGTGEKQVRLISDYDGTSKVATLDKSWKTQPDMDSLYAIYGESGLASAGDTSTITLDGNQSSIVSADLYLKIINGTGAGQTRKIQGIIGDVVTLTTSWDTTPDSTSRYVIFGGWGGILEQVKDFSQRTSLVILDEKNGESAILYNINSINSTETFVKNNYEQINSIHTSSIITEYFRIELIGMGTSLTGAIQTTFHSGKSKNISIALGDNIDDSSDADLVKAVITGRQSNGKYKNILSDNSGALSVNIQNPKSTYGNMPVDTQVPKIQMSFIYNLDPYSAVVEKAYGVNVRMVTKGTDSVAQIQDLYIIGNGSQYTSSGNADYFTILNGDSSDFYIWMNVDSGNNDPAPGGTGIEVGISSSDSPSTIASAIQTAVDGNVNFSAVLADTKIRITNGANGNVRSINATNMPSSISSNASTSDSVLSLTLGDGTNTAYKDYIFLRSRRALIYKAGQGLVARISAKFNQPQTGISQYIGLFSPVSSLFIGYNSSKKFTVLRRTSAIMETRTLTISSGASGSETANVRLDGVDFQIPITSGSASHNAEEIASHSYFNIAGFKAEAIGDKVVFTSDKEDGPRAEEWSFSSSTASASFSRTKAGRLFDKNFTSQGSFNLDKLDGTGPSGVVLNPEKGNIYQIRYKWLGYGSITYSIEDPNSGAMIDFHREIYVNKNIKPSLINPHMYLGWFTECLSGTGSVSLEGSSAGGFIEGSPQKIIYKSVRSTVQSKTTTDGSITPVFSIRNPFNFNGLTNQANIIPKSMSFISNTSGGGTLFMYKNPTLTGANYDYVDEGNSCALIDTSSTAISGMAVSSVSIAGTDSEKINFSVMDLNLQRDDVITFAIQRASVLNNLDATMSLNWAEEY